MSLGIALPSGELIPTETTNASTDTGLSPPASTALTFLENTQVRPLLVPATAQRSFVPVLLTSSTAPPGRP